MRCEAIVPKSYYCQDHRCNLKGLQCRDGRWYCDRHDPVMRECRARVKRKYVATKRWQRLRLKRIRLDEEIIQLALEMAKL